MGLGTKFEFRNAPSLRDSLTITGTARNSVDETWEQPWGEVARVRDHHNELRVSVAETVEPGRRLDVVFRVFDDGIGFRYELPEQSDLQSFEIMKELTENYEGQPAFQFIRDVPVDWQRTEVLDGAIGDYVVVARQERGGPDWYVGAITDEEVRTFEIPLSFLPEGASYVAEIYADGEGANWLNNPFPIAISQQTVDAGSTLTLALAPGGGQAIRIRPAR